MTLAQKIGTFRSPTVVQLFVEFIMRADGEDHSNTSRGTSTFVSFIIPYKMQERMNQ